MKIKFCKKNIDYIFIKISQMFLLLRKALFIKVLIKNFKGNVNLEMNKYVQLKF